MMSPKQVILLSNDLFFVPTVRQATDGTGCQLIVVQKAETERTNQLNPVDVVAWVIDLNAVPFDGISSATTLWTERFPHAIRFAFGPHVQTARLEAAQQAGCQQVLSRGQFSTQFERILRKHLS